MSKASEATLPKAIKEVWKLGHRKDFGGHDAVVVVINRLPAAITAKLTADERVILGQHIIDEIDGQLEGNKQRALPYYERAMGMLE